MSHSPWPPLESDKRTKYVCREKGRKINTHALFPIQHNSQKEHFYPYKHTACLLSGNFSSRESSFPNYLTRGQNQISSWYMTNLMMLSLITHFGNEAIALQVYKIQVCLEREVKR